MRRRIIAIMVAAIIALTIANLPTIATAAPVRQRTLTITQPDSTTLILFAHGDEWCHWLTDADGHLMLQDELGYYRPATPQQEEEWQEVSHSRMQQLRQANEQRSKRRQMNRSRNLMPEAASHTDETTQSATDRSRGLVVLVEFTDKKFIVENPLQQYRDMMMKPGYNYSSGKYTHYGSAYDYFYQNSMGRFNPQFDVFGPIQLAHESSYYGENDKLGYDKRAHEMIIEACDYLNEQGLDFSPYDNNGDKVIDFVFAIYAGTGENATQVADEVWPHAWSISDAGEGYRHFYDGICLEDYACTCELYGKIMDGIGTFCHEFSHVLGLPDVYDTRGGSTNTPNFYSVLDNGCYLQNGYHPVGYSAYERYQLGWLSPIELTTASTDTLTELGTSNQAYILPVTEDFDEAQEKEYFLFENRQKSGWDKYLPGHGMLVWHVDYNEDKWQNNVVNTWNNHPCIRLVEASRGTSLYADSAAPFPGNAHISEFTDDTNPALSGWTNPGTSNGLLTHRLDKPITNIREVLDPDSNRQIIIFDFMGGETGIQQVQQDNAAHPSTILLHNHHLIITTGSGSYDLMGHKL